MTTSEHNQMLHPSNTPTFASAIGAPPPSSSSSSLPLPVLHQQRLYLISSIARTQIIVDGLAARLAECDRQLAATKNSSSSTTATGGGNATTTTKTSSSSSSSSSSNSTVTGAATGASASSAEAGAVATPPLPRRAKKKLQQARWRARASLRAADREQVALFRALKGCQDAILAAQDRLIRDPGSWAPGLQVLGAGVGGYSCESGWFVPGQYQGQQMQMHHQPAYSWPFVTAASEASDVAAAPETEEVGWAWHGHAHTHAQPHEHEQYFDAATVDPALLLLDPAGAGGAPGPTEVVDETGLTHYIYPVSSPSLAPSPIDEDGNGEGLGEGEYKEQEEEREEEQPFSGFREGWDMAAACQSARARMEAGKEDDDMMEDGEGDGPKSPKSPRSLGPARALWPADMETEKGADVHEGEGEGGGVQEPQRRYSAAAVDLILYRMRLNEGKEGKGKGKGKGRAKGRGMGRGRGGGDAMGAGVGVEGASLG